MKRIIIVFAMSIILFSCSKETPAPPPAIVQQSQPNPTPAAVSFNGKYYKVSCNCSLPGYCPNALDTIEISHSGNSITTGFSGNKYILNNYISFTLNGYADGDSAIISSKQFNSLDFMGGSMKLSGKTLTLKYDFQHLGTDLVTKYWPKYNLIYIKK